MRVYYGITTCANIVFDVHWFSAGVGMEEDSRCVIVLKQNHMASMEFEAASVLAKGCITSLYLRTQHIIQR